MLELEQVSRIIINKIKQFRISRVLKGQNIKIIESNFHLQYLVIASVLAKSNKGNEK